ncbi:type VI secretion system tube protein Hcp [Spirosoma koreense]
MKKLYVFLVTVIALFCTGTAFSQDIYFSAVGAREDANSAPVTSGTLTANASPQQEGALRNFATITSFQYGYENASTIGSAGNNVGKTQLNAITITKNVDQSSNRLMQAGLSGIILSSAQILVTRSSGDNAAPATVYKIDLKNAIITEFNASAGVGTGCTNGCVGESFKIIYGAIQVTTYTQSNTGVITANPPATWNQTTNTANF